MSSPSLPALTPHTTGLVDRSSKKCLRKDDVDYLIEAYKSILTKLGGSQS